MKGSGAGWDSILYRVYIIGGLIGVVAATVGTVVLFDPEGRTDLPIYVGGGCVSLFLLGVLVYWWIQILFANYGDITRMTNEADIAAPEISSLKSWSTLFEAMVKYGGDPDALNISRRKGGRSVIEWFAWATVLTLFPLAGVWIYLFGVITQQAFLAYVRPAIVTLAVLMLIRTYFLLKGTARDDEETIFIPLRLKLIGSSPAGMVLEGQRHGCSVRITANGSHCITHVAGIVPNFKVESKDGKFQLPDNLPGTAFNAFKGLRKARRWVGVNAEGNADGITIERHTRGMNLWLYDLWLAERIMKEKNE